MEVIQKTKQFFYFIASKILKTLIFFRENKSALVVTKILPKSGFICFHTGVCPTFNVDEMDPDAYDLFYEGGTYLLLYNTTF